VGRGIGEPAPRDHELEAPRVSRSLPRSIRGGQQQKAEARGVERAAIEGGMRDLGQELGDRSAVKIALAVKGS